MADKPPLIGGTGDGESRSTAKDDLESASVSSTGSNIVDVTDTGNFTTSVNIETQQGTETPPDNTHTGHVKRTDGKERENSSVCSRHENISVGPQSRIDPHSSRETPSHSGVHQQTSSGDSLPPSYPRNIDPESAQNGNATAKSGDVHEHQVTTPLEKQNSNSEGQRFGVAKQNVTTIDAVSNIKLLQQTSDKSPPTELQDANKEDPHASAVGGTSTAEMMDNKPPDRVEVSNICTVGCSTEYIEITVASY